MTPLISISNQIVETLPIVFSILIIRKSITTFRSRLSWRLKLKLRANLVTFYVFELCTCLFNNLSIVFVCTLLAKPVSFWDFQFEASTFDVTHVFAMDFSAGVCEAFA